jgi:hypothetical protein
MVAFAVAALLLVPWTAWLAGTLPSDHLDRRWDVAWTGFDVGLLFSLGATAYFGLRKSGWVIIAATIAGSFLLIDAWFDCLTAKTSWEYLTSLTSAICIELPLAALAFWSAYRTGKQCFAKAPTR